jgi:hypothetical protein
MEKITGMLQRWRKNILNYNMNKSEKCYYAVIGNKKRGKFSGAGPIEVAKKVASKKLKTEKEMEFYLDEVGGKTRRYGPYQARKDKKSGKVAVVKARKVMKGGLLSSRDRDILIHIFNNNCSYLKIRNDQETHFIKQVSFNDIKIYFVVPSVLIFFLKNDKEQIYTHAIFVDPNRTYVWILKKNNNTVVFISFADFFLNPEYLSQSERTYIIDYLNKNILSIRRYEANIINPILSDINSVVKPLNKKSNIGIYLPDYSRPLIRKCVYPDLTFGILDEETPARIPQNSSSFRIPDSPYQKYLILKNTGISGMSFNEPIIYVKVANIPQNQRGGTLTVEQIDNYLKQIDELISKIQIRNIINANKDSRKYLKYNMNHIKLTATSGIKKINDDISQLESIIINLPKKTQFRIISENEKKLQLERLNELKSILLQQKLKINFPQLQNQQFSIKLLQQQLQQEQLQSKLQQQLQQEQLQSELQQQLQQKQLNFDYCIFSSGSKLKIMFYDKNEVQDFILMGTNLISIPIQIFNNLIDIPRLFGEFRRIRDISDMRIRQQKPQAFVPQIISESRKIRQVPQVSYQQKPLTIAMFEKKIADLFNESTIKSYNIKIEILLKNLNPIIDELYRLNTEYQTNQQNPELQVKLRELYQQLGIIFQDTMRESK